MKRVKLSEVVKWYEDGDSNLESFIFNVRINHRNVNTIKTNYLRDQLHPELQKLYWNFIKKVEDETHMAYYGIEDTLADKNTDLTNLVLTFQHYTNFKTTFNISYGSVISCGSGEYETFRFEDNGEVRLWITTPSCHASYGELRIYGDKFEEELFDRIKHFDESEI